jgi:hypothetical protein
MSLPVGPRATSGRRSDPRYSAFIRGNSLWFPKHGIIDGNVVFEFVHPDQESERFESKADLKRGLQFIHADDLPEHCLIAVPADARDWKKLNCDTISARNFVENLCAFCAFCG